MAMTTEELLEIERWHFRNNTTRCRCRDCERLNIFAANYFAVRDGARFDQAMMQGLTDDERETFVKLICLRNLEEK